jgi:hypothetical protein
MVRRIPLKPRKSSLIFVIRAYETRSSVSLESLRSGFYSLRLHTSIPSRSSLGSFLYYVRFITLLDSKESKIISLI